MILIKYKLTSSRHMSQKLNVVYGGINYIKWYILINLYTYNNLWKQ